MDLLRQAEDAAILRNAPLAVRMRPRTLDEIVGQEEFLGPGKLLRRMLDANRLSSLIFHGPPGTGKTTLAQVIAGQIDCVFHALDAPGTSVAQVRDIAEKSRSTLAAAGKRTVVFIDELHRFNRAQQDVLLNDVESGVMVLIGATTENPFFAINSPLLSRSTVFRFQPLSEADVVGLCRRALADKERGLGQYKVQATDEALAHLATISDGDARRALTALEIGVLSQLQQLGGTGFQPVQEGTGSKPVPRQAEIVFDLTVAQESIQQKAIRYDKAGDEHYDAVSAFIKSMRGSDPDATVYWLARMLVAGEDPLFVARRIAILSSEDVGNADPRAISVASAAYAITERIGMPECQLTLAQAAIYMACAPKSNASAMAVWGASADVKEQRTVPVPKHLRNAPHPKMKELYGHSEGYQYSHSFPGGVSPDQDYLGVDKTYYVPTDRGYEKHIAAYLDWAKKLRDLGSGTRGPGKDGTRD